MFKKCEAVYSDDLSAPISFGGGGGGGDGESSGQKSSSERSKPNPNCYVDLPGPYCIGTYTNNPAEAASSGKFGGIGIVPDTINVPNNSSD